MSETVNAAEVSPNELHKALLDADGPEVDRYDWPYINDFTIDGAVEPLLRWLCKNYRITPR